MTSPSPDSTNNNNTASSTESNNDNETQIMNTSVVDVGPTTGEQDSTPQPTTTTEAPNTTTLVDTATEEVANENENNSNNNAIISTNENTSNGNAEHSNNNSSTSTPIIPATTLPLQQSPPTSAEEQQQQQEQPEQPDAPIPYLELAPTYFTTQKYNEQPFNRRYYSFHSFANNSKHHSTVKQLHSIVYDDWQHCTDRAPINYARNEPVEFYRPTGAQSNEMNMVFDATTGTWTMLASNQSNSGNNNGNNHGKDGAGNMDSSRSSLDTYSGSETTMSVCDDVNNHHQQHGGGNGGGSSMIQRMNSTGVQRYDSAMLATSAANANSNNNNGGGGVTFRQSFDTGSSPSLHVVQQPSHHPQQQQQQQQQQTPQHRNIFKNVFHQLPRLSMSGNNNNNNNNNNNQNNNTNSYQHYGNADMTDVDSSNELSDPPSPTHPSSPIGNISNDFSSSSSQQQQRSSFSERSGGRVTVNSTTNPYHTHGSGNNGDHVNEKSSRRSFLKNLIRGEKRNQQHGGGSGKNRDHHDLTSSTTSTSSSFITRKKSDKGATFGSSGVTNNNNNNGGGGSSNDESSEWSSYGGRDSNAGYYTSTGRDSFSSIFQSSTSTHSHSASFHHHNNHHTHGGANSHGHYNSEARHLQQQQLQESNNAQLTRLTHGSIIEYLERKAINDAELSSVVALTKDSSLDKLIDLRDETRILSVHDPQYEFVGGKERISCRRKRQSSDPYISAQSSKKKDFFLFQYDQLKLDCGAWEPLFCTIYLYDAKYRRKLSESYSFSISGKSELNLLDGTVREQVEKLQEANIYERPTALFRLTEPHSDIYMIVHVDRVLQSSPDESDRVYEKDSRLRDRALKRNKESIMKLSFFRQPFLVGSFNIYADANGSGTTGTTSSVRPSYTIIDGIRMIKFRRLTRLNNREVFDIGKYLPETESTMQDLVPWATMRAEIKSVDTDSINDLFVTYSQSKQKMEDKMHPVHLQRNKRVNRFGLETSLCTFFDAVDEFPLLLPLSPALEFKNTLYLYLDTADLAFASFKHTTFVVEVCLKKMDTATATKVACVADPFDPVRLNTSGLSTVVKHERAPQFLSEFRIEVPMDAAYTSNYHLFFEIFAVKTNVFGSHPHQYGYAVLKSVGSCFMKLFNNDNAMIRDGAHSLPIYTKMEDGYLKDDFKCTRAKGYALNVRTRHASTVFMQDNSIALLMHCLDDLHDLLDKWNGMNRKKHDFFEKMTNMVDQLNRDIPRIVYANFVEFIPYSHVMLNSLLKVMSQLYMIVPSEDDFHNYSSDDELMFLHSFKKQTTLLVRNVFSALLYCLHGVTAVEGRKGRESKTLMAYIDTFFDITARDPFFVTLFDYWIQFIEGENVAQLSSYRHKFESQYPLNYEKRRKSWTRIEFEKAGMVSPRQPRTSVVEEMPPELVLNAIDIMNFSWFFFELAIKSIMLHEQRSTTVMDQFKHRINELVARLCPILVSCTQQRKTKGVINEIARRCNYDLALFFRDLLQFTDASFVNSLLDNYLNMMACNDTDSSEAEYAKISHVMDLLDLMVEYDGLTNFFIDDKDMIHQTIERMIENIIRGTRNSHNDLRLKSVYVFRKHLTKLDFDVRFSATNDPNHSIRRKIMYPYFKFVHLFIEDMTLMHSAPSIQTIVDALVCIYSILLFTDEQRVITWLNTNPNRYLSSFYDILLLTSIIVRKYDNMKTRINLVKLLPRVFVQYIQRFCSDMSQEFSSLATELGVAFKKELDKDSTNSEEEVIHILASRLESQTSNFDGLSQFVKLFDRCSYFYVNLLLLKPHVDAGLFIETVTNYVYPFLQKFHPFYLVSRIARLKFLNIDQMIDKSSNDKIAKYESASAWQMMTAAILLNTALPIDLAVPVFGDCLQIMLLIFQRVEANVGDEEEVVEEVEEHADAQSPSTTSTGNGENGVELECNDDEQHQQQQPTRPVQESPKKSGDAASIVPEGYINYTNENSHMIRAATFRKLVERLFQNNPGYTPPFNDCFLLTYFSVASSNQVLQEIISITHEVSREADKSQKLLRVVNALKMWVTDHFESMDCVFMASLISFLANDLTKIIRDELSTLTYHRPLLSSLLRKMIDVHPEKRLQPKATLECILPVNFHGHQLARENFDIFEWDSMELARQITLIDAQYFMQIKHTELIAKKKTFDAPDLSVRMATAPNLTKMSLQFDALSSWVQTCILRETSVDERVKYITKLFEICEKLYEIGNFHSCFAIRSGFRQSGVIRLAKTWQKIPHIEDTITKKYGELYKHPYTNLLAEYDMRPPPMIPLAAQLQAEVYFASLNSKYVLDKVSATGEKLVNYDRMRLLSRVIRRLKIKQQVSYSFTPIPFLIDYFSHLESMDEDTAYNTSLELEPKNRS